MIERNVIATAVDQPDGPIAASSEQISAARQAWRQDGLEIDDDAVVSECPDGVWVSAWVWVSGEPAAESQSSAGQEGL